MPAMTLMDGEVKVIFASIALFALLVLFYYLIRLIRELIPTVRQVRRAVRELERTIQNSQEIVYNLKSISRTLDKQVGEAQEIIDTARAAVGNVHAVTSAISRPVTGLKNVLMGIGYGMKYLLKRNPSYEEEEL